MGTRYEGFEQMYVNLKHFFGHEFIKKSCNFAYTEAEAW